VQIGAAEAAAAPAMPHNLDEEEVLVQLPAVALEVSLQGSWYQLGAP
jgi:hypothetical protein